ncbi:MAG: serine hydrolase [Nitrospirae bacterium]|nr:serine hydrolase [Nitrospirota bacterium]
MFDFAKKYLVKNIAFSRQFIFYLFLAFLSGMAIEYFFLKFAHSSRSSAAPGISEVRKTFGYSLTNHLVECDIPSNAPDNDKITVLKKKVENTINQDIGSKRILSASVYFRDLDCGRWFSLGSSEQFEPASLLKVPIMISVLRAAENDPGILLRKVKFSVPENLYNLQRIMPPELMDAGKSYTVDDLLFRMIAYSDNNATYLLEDVVNPEFREEVFADINVDSPYKNPDKTVYVSAARYASFFRILYNSSYLNREMSERALNYLTRSTFSDGIVAGVPSGTKVAHKFGEKTDEHNPQTKYLSDCGIVYYPQHPYLLCVMTTGKQFDELGGIIQKISREVYNDVYSHCS